MTIPNLDKANSELFQWCENFCADLKSLRAEPATLYKEFLKRMEQAQKARMGKPKYIKGLIYYKYKDDVYYYVGSEHLQGGERVYLRNENGKEVTAWRYEIELMNIPESQLSLPTEENPVKRVSEPKPSYREDTPTREWEKWGTWVNQGDRAEFSGYILDEDDIRQVEDAVVARERERAVKVILKLLDQLFPNGAVNSECKTTSHSVQLYGNQAIHEIKGGRE